MAWRTRLSCVGGWVVLIQKVSVRVDDTVSVRTIFI